MDEMTVVRPRREILGGIALGVAVAATAMGVYNRVQIEQLKTELFEVRENTGRLFEVVQDFSQNMIALETGFNKIGTTLLHQVMFNPTLFDLRLSGLENQLRGRLRQVTHAIQAAMHQRFAIDHLNPAELVHLFQQLSKRPTKPDANYWCSITRTCSRWKPPFSSTAKTGTSSFMSLWLPREHCSGSPGFTLSHCPCLTLTTL
jgi:hypothetical protein